MNIKENILNTLSANLSNIKIANGYSTDLKNVFIGSYDIQNLNSFPVITIAEGNSKEINNYNIKGDERIELDLLIRSYVEKSTTASNTINSINIKADIKKNLYGDTGILETFTSTLKNIKEIKKITVAEETGLLDYNSKIDYTITLLKIEYLQNGNNIDGSSYVPVVPHILDAYALTSTTEYLQNQINSITGNTIDLSNYSVTSHSHSVITNSLTVSGSLNTTSANLSAPLYSTAIETQGNINAGYQVQSQIGWHSVVADGGNNYKIQTASWGDSWIGLTNLTWDGHPSGRLGLGTMTPTEKLSVSGNVSVTGNVGIGKAPSALALDVNGDVNIASGSYYRTNTNPVIGQVGSEIYMGWFGTGGAPYIKMDFNTATHKFINGTNTILTLSGNGNIGIGTTGDIPYKVTTGKSAIGHYQGLHSDANYTTLHGADYLILDCRGQQLYFDSTSFLPLTIQANLGRTDFRWGSLWTKNIQDDGTNVSLSGKIITNSLTGYTGTITASQTFTVTNGIITSIS